MQEKFQAKCPVKYFTDFSAENLERIYAFFLNWIKGVQAENDWRNIYVPTDANPSNDEKMLLICSCLDLYFKAGVFRKVGSKLYGMEVVEAAPSPLPSVMMSGKYFTRTILSRSL